MNQLTYFYLLFFLASLSYTASQIAIFLINKVTGWRLLFATCYSIFVFVLQITLWAISIHTLASLLFQTAIPTSGYVTIFEPILVIFLWSIFTILPFIGRGISTLIFLLVLLCAIQGIMSITPLTFFQAFTCTFGGWALLTFLHVLFEKALIRKSNPFWTLATGRSKKLTSGDIQDQLRVINDEVVELIQKAERT
jgi:hypothetical protein